MARKRPKPDGERAIVNFDFQDHTYQIDPQRQKVYRRFVEIETSKAMQIFSVWRAEQAGA